MVQRAQVLRVECGLSDEAVGPSTAARRHAVGCGNPALPCHTRSPERIRGDSYTFNTDVWSLGLLVLECAQGRYPYPPQQQQGEGSGAAAAAAATLVPAQLGFWELLEYIGVSCV